MTDKIQESGFIDDPLYKPLCNDYNHNPPYNVHIPEGKMYRHVCPACKEVTIIRRPLITYNHAPPAHPSPFPYSLRRLFEVRTEND